MLPLTKAHAVQLLVDSVGILERCEDDGAQKLAVEIREAVKFSIQVRMAKRALEVKTKEPRAPRNVDVARAERMASMYQQGLLLEQIGEHFGVTRERVRQIIKKLGLTSEHGGQRKCAEQKRLALESKREARSMAIWGMSRAEMKPHRFGGTVRAFKNQRNAAASRGIAWSLTFPQWLEVWERSGKLAQRGRGKDRYVMSRIKDDGGYVFGNVHVQASTENNSQGLKKCRGNKAKFTGVWCIYPGLSKPWIAKAGRKLLGMFATEEEAAAARAAYVGDTPPNIRAGCRGYSVYHGVRGDRYFVAVGKTYVGTFGTPEEALAARQAFIDKQAALTQPDERCIEGADERGDSLLSHAPHGPFFACAGKP